MYSEDQIYRLMENILLLIVNLKKKEMEKEMEKENNINNNKQDELVVKTIELLQFYKKFESNDAAIIKTIQIFEEITKNVKTREDAIKALTVAINFLRAFSP